MTDTKYETETVFADGTSDMSANLDINVVIEQQTEISTPRKEDEDSYYKLSIIFNARHNGFSDVTVNIPNFEPSTLDELGMICIAAAKTMKEIYDKKSE